MSLWCLWYTITFMKVLCSLLFISYLLTAISCVTDKEKPGLYIFSNTFDFDKDQHGFLTGFSDYPAELRDTAFYKLKSAYTIEPGGQKAIMLSGNNYSDDLFMYLKKKLTGLQPATDYTIIFNVEFASDAKAGNVGAGGSPGESVFLKAGATGIEPKSVIESGNYVMNIDKGNQAGSGSDMITIGNVAVPATAEGYTKIVRTNSSFTDNPLKVRSNESGELWLIVGTDSGFEGTTTIYYTSISVVLSATNY